MTGTDFFNAMLDPRGRMSRSGFLMASLVIMGLEILGSLLIFKGGIAPDSYFIGGLKIIMLWLCFTSLAKRLHDVGYSAWWLAAAVMALAAWVAAFVSAFIAIAGLEALRPGMVGSYALYAGAMMPALGLLFWLQLAQGEARANAFGVEPDGRGFGAPEGKAAQGKGAQGFSISQPVQH